MKSLLLLISITFLLIPQIASGQNICIDTLIYPKAKATNFLATTCNVPSEFAGYSQYYDAPQEVIVKGFKIYMGVNSSNPLDTAIVSGFLMDANPDSSVSTILRQKGFTVYNTYDLTDISIMEYHVLFDTPDTVSSGFHVGVRTTSTTPLAIIGNDYIAGDGNGEELGYWYWTGDDTWYESNAFFTWDIDFLILPIVEYITSNSIASTVLGCTESVSCINYTPAPILNHRMYNEKAFNGGTVSDTVSFNWGDGNSTTYPDTCNIFSENGNYDFFAQYYTGWDVLCLIKDSIVITPYPNYSITDTITACETFVWDVNGNAYSTSILDTVFLSTATGCDSTKILNLTINTLDVSVTNTSPILTANLSDATYQWLDCPGMTPIIGATNQIYTASENGEFAVMVTKEGCTATSTCSPVTGLTIIENDFSNELQVFPNPNNGHFTITLGETDNAVKITLTDLTGRLIQTNSYNQNQLLDVILEEADGVYLLYIESAENRAVIRLIIEA